MINIERYSVPKKLQKHFVDACVDIFEDCKTETKAPDPVAHRVMINACLALMQRVAAVGGMQLELTEKRPPEVIN